MKLPVLPGCRLGLLPRPRGCQDTLPGQGTGPGYLYVLHSTRREYTESKSLSTSRPAAWGQGECQGRGDARSKPQGSAKHITTSRAAATSSAEPRDGEGHGSSQ